MLLLILHAILKIVALAVTARLLKASQSHNVKSSCDQFVGAKSLHQRGARQHLGGITRSFRWMSIIIRMILF